MLKRFILLLMMVLLFSCSKNESETIHPQIEFFADGFSLLNNDDFDYYNVSIIIDGKHFAYCNYLSSGMRKGFAYFELDSVASYERLKNAHYNISLQDFEKNELRYTNEVDQEIANNKIIRRKEE
ncbi:hypothetical protein [Flavobacterium sp. '19STA2R22 D10 B1']|uniref:hypothetical protein n=1 Tax=Flavobacterium aerium TaxID=3037261 RepID=UPI00278C4A87|nr:hypothetical protein [Flavobacterium sp. '19STA2R22 D10 B1']